MRVTRANRRDWRFRRVPPPRIPEDPIHVCTVWRIVRASEFPRRPFVLSILSLLLAPLPSIRPVRRRRANASKQPREDLFHECKTDEREIPRKVLEDRECGEGSDGRREGVKDAPSGGSVDKW